ncbi:TPA: hypothetical protein ACGHFD_003941 [Escherichia coli]
MEVVDIRMTHAPGYGVPGEAGQPFLVAFVEPFVAGLIAESSLPCCKWW